MTSAPQNRLLKIDLSKEFYEVEEIPKQVLRKYMGGRGLGSYLLYKSVPPKADPLGEDNHIIFAAGPANGTNFFYSSKASLSTKSPLTNVHLFTISSGSLGHKLRQAGFWAIDIRGIAKEPTYLLVNNQQIEFRNGAHLWGLKPAEAQRVMLDGLMPDDAATIAIGPAGEQLIKYASVFSEGDRYRCFGRGGAGCVMGSKHLKGMVVAGNGKIEIPHEGAFEAVKREITRKLQTDRKGWADMWRRYETASDLELMNELGAIPTKNWQFGQFEGWRGIDKSTTPMGWPEKGRACGPYCPTPGTREVSVQDGLYKGAHSDIEWETIYAFGSGCGVDNMEAIIAASQICDEFGIDTMSAGITIGFAMECFERGLISLKDTDRIQLRFGDDRAMIAMLRKIVSQEGFGKKLAEGTRRLSEQIKGSEAFAMHVKGLELGGYECRGLNGQALEFAINTRGGCHHTYGLQARVETADGTHLNVEGKGEKVKRVAISSMLYDSLIFCVFAGPRILSNEMTAETVSSLSEEEWSVSELNRVGERIMCQERLFNMREGITRKDDTLPARLLREPKPDGPSRGAVVPLEELKDDFYKAMGYDLSTGNPTDDILEALEINK